jgi:outer membrane protein OmpA-like peptidoglycan-associated protein
VANFLVEQGVAQSALQVIGFGERFPVKLGRAESARKWNRRVQVQEIKQPAAVTARKP